jgi:iron complex outermembrane receptor protein
MEKNRKRFGPGRFYPQVKKLVRIMKLTALLVILVISQALAVNSYSQVTRLSLDMNNSTVKDVLIEIERSTDFYFLYSNQLIDVERKVDIKLNNKKVDEILDEVFKGTNIQYAITDRQIILKPQSATNEFFSVQAGSSVSGTVTDESGNPIPGATIILKGTTNGTITDMDGRFTLEVSGSNPVLVVSFVGMKTEEVTYTGQSQLTISLQSDVIGLDEVVAIGYGKNSRKNLSSAVTSVKADELNRGAIADVGQLLQGKVPGLNISASGDPTRGATVIMRGSSTLNHLPRIRLSILAKTAWQAEVPTKVRMSFWKTFSPGARKLKSTPSTQWWDIRGRTIP